MSQHEVSFFFFKVTFYPIKRTPYFFDDFFRVKVFSFQFYQKRGHLLGSWLYFNMYITLTCTLRVQITEKMACGLQNGRGQPESVFFVFSTPAMD